EHDAGDYFDPAAGMLVCNAHSALPFGGSWAAGRTARASPIVATACAGTRAAAEVALAPIAAVGRAAGIARLTRCPLLALTTLLSRAAAWWSPEFAVAGRSVIATTRIARVTRRP